MDRHEDQSSTPPSVELELLTELTAAGLDTEPSSATRLWSVLTKIRDRFGFDTVTLFAPSAPGGWRVAERIGPIRAWHTVLDPQVFPELLVDDIHRSAATIPGIGSRLSALGCGAVATLTVWGGARLVLDADHEIPIEQAMSFDQETIAPLVRSLLGFMPAASRTAVDPVLSKITRSVRDAVMQPETTLVDLLGHVEDSTLAAGVGLLIERRGMRPEVIVRRGGPAVGDDTLMRILGDVPLSEPLPYEIIARVARELGLHGLTVHAGSIRCDAERQTLIAGWVDRPAITRKELETITSIVAVAGDAISRYRTTLTSEISTQSKRWAEVIHDGIAQAVTAAAYHIEDVRRSLDDQSSEVLDQSLMEIKRSLSDLRAVMFRATGPAPSAEISAAPYALRSTVSDVIRRWRLPIEASVEGDLADVSSPIAAVALSVIREAVVNAARHAGVDAVAVIVRHDVDGLVVSIEDHGRGFGVAIESIPESRFGVRLMQQRVASVGGTLSIASQPGGGTVVRATFPGPTQQLRW